MCSEFPYEFIIQGNTMNKNRNMLTTFIFVLIFTFAISINTEAKVRINKKHITLNISEKYTLKLKGSHKSIKWKSSKPKIAKVSKKGCVTAIKKGKAVITARTGQKKYKCSVVVKDNFTKTTNFTDNTTTQKPSITPPAPHIHVSADNKAQSTAPPKSPSPTDPTLDPPSIWVPGITCFDVLKGYYVIDIDYDFINIEHESFGGEIFDINDSTTINVVYNGTVTKNDNDPSPYYVDIKGEPMEYKDIKTGDKVDVIYSFSYPVNDKEPKRNISCCAINVYKRE